jgi:predicted nucleic acid-binding protein
LSVTSEPQSAVVDTDVVSLTFKRDTRASLYQPHLDGRALTVSFMTVAELQRWALERRWGDRQRSELDRYLRQFTVYHSNADLCRWWASVMAGARQKGRRIEVADAWIAATALLHGVPLIMHNPGDYLGVDELQIITVAAAT